MNHENYCSYELSKKLKEKGFDWDVLFYYNSYHDVTGSRLQVHYHVDEAAYNFNAEYMVHKHGLYDTHELMSHTDCLCSAPTLYQAQKWLRDKHKIMVEPFACISDRTWAYRLYQLNDEKWGMTIVQDGKAITVYGFDLYESALSAGIIKALESI